MRESSFENFESLSPGKSPEGSESLTVEQAIANLQGQDQFAITQLGGWADSEFANRQRLMR